MSHKTLPNMAKARHRNPLLLTSLPVPLVFLASFQLTGRGRGSNIWLSPPGCLQFSLLLDLPCSLAGKLVFIQYLMALAVCEAIDDDGRLGARIKWPNDIYAEAEGVGGTQLGSGSGRKRRAKLGGILVNTNFVGGKWRIVIGESTQISLYSPLKNFRMRNQHPQCPPHDFTIPASLPAHLPHAILYVRQAAPSTANDGRDFRTGHECFRTEVGTVH
jgi:hypothetical protein